MNLPMTKTCEVCGNEFRMPADCAPSQWAPRRVCGLTCVRRLGQRRASDAKRVWTKADLLLANGLAEQHGKRWAKIWRALAPDGRGSPDGLRMAVAAYRNGTWTPPSGEEPKNLDRRMPDLEAEAFLSRPPARLLAQLEQLPDCERRFVKWQGWQTGGTP